MNPTPDRPNPFIGPRPFREEEQLFGRERETGQLFNLVLAERVVLLYSPSGAGKTSLLRASLLPRLKGRRFTVLPMLRVNLAPNPAHPTANRYLFSVLTDLEEAYPEAERLPEAELAAMRLADYMAARTSDRSVLIFDQFEEILTLDPTDTESKQEFFNQVGEALQEPSRFAVFAMREDYLAGLEPYLRPLPNRLKATFRLDLLGKAAAQEVVERTAHQGGVDFSAEAAARLVEDLSRVQVQQPDGSLSAVTGAYVEPVQLQVVGYNLWQKLKADQTAITLGELDEIGNVDLSLAEYYAARVKFVAETTRQGERWIRRWFERKLITESGIRGQVLMEPEVSGGLSNEAIRLLEDAHLVRRDTRRGTTWFELTHDRLLNPIQQDNTAWFNTNLSLLQRQAELWRDQGMRDDLLLRDQALLDVEAWADAHATELSELEGDFLRKCRAVRQQEQERRDKEHKQRRRLQIYTGVAVAAAAIAIVLVFIATYASSRANQAKEEADINANKALAAEQTALEARDEANAQRKEADAQRQQAEQSAVTAKREREIAEYEQSMARAGELAAEARLASPAFPQRSLLLAVEAARAAKPFSERHAATLQSLMESLSLAGGNGEGSTYEEIQNINISPSGRWLVVDFDSSQRFYNLANGELELLPWIPQEQLSPVNRLFFSASERWLYDSDTFRLYDLDSPEPLDTPALDLSVQRGALPDSVRSVLFIDSQVDSDSEWLAILMKNELWLVDLDDPKLPIRRIPTGDDNYFLNLRASPPAKKGGSRWLWLKPFGIEAAPVVLVDLAAAQENRPALINLPGDLCSGVLDFSTGGDRLYGMTPESNSLCYWDLFADGFPATDSGVTDLVSFSYYANDVGRIAFGQDTGRAGPFSQSRVSRGLPNVLQEIDGKWLTWDLSSVIPELYSTINIPPPLPQRADEFPFSAIRLRSPDGRWLLDSRGDQAVLHDLLAWSPITSFNLEGFSYIDIPRRFSPDGRWLLTGCYDSQACLYDLSRENPGQDPIVLGGHESWIGLFAFSQDGSRLVTASADTTIRLWNLYRKGFSASPILLGTLPEAGKYPILAISPNSRWLFYDHALWDLAPLSREQDPDSLVLPRITALVAVFSPDSRWLAVATTKGKPLSEVAESQNAELYLWDLQAQRDILEKLPLVLTSSLENIAGLTFSPDSLWLADNTGDLWYLPEIDRSAGEQTRRSIPPGALRFTADNQALVIVTEEGQVEWLKLDPAGETEPISSGVSGTPLAVSPDGRWLVTRAEGFYQLWTLDSGGRSLLNREMLVGDYDSLQFSPDSRFLAIGNWETFNLLKLDLPELHTDQFIEVKPSNASASQMKSMAMLFSAKGQWFINNDAPVEDVSLFGALALPLNTNRPLVSQSGAGIGYEFFGFGGGGGGSSGGIGLDVQTFLSAYLWPVDRLFEDPSLMPTALGGHASEIQTFLISPNETWAVTLSGSRQLRLWNLIPAVQKEALQPILLPEAEGAITALGFTPDNRWLVTGDESGQVKLWLLDSINLEIAACRVAGRNLTLTEWQRYFPNEPYRKSCPDLPLHSSVVKAVSSDMAQHAARRDFLGAVELARQLTEQEPSLPLSAFDWLPVCTSAAANDSYDLVRVECQAAGIDEASVRAAAAIGEAQSLIATGQFSLALEAITRAEALNFDYLFYTDLLCGKAASDGKFYEVQTACEDWGYTEQIARMTYWYQQFSDFMVNGRYREAAELLSDSFQLDPVFMGYMSVHLDMVGNLCYITHATGDGYDLIEDYCQTSLYNNMYFKVYLLLDDARAKLQSGDMIGAAASLDQAAGEQSRAPVGDPFQEICTLAAQLDLDRYGDYCLLAGYDLDVLKQEILAKEYNAQLQTLVNFGDFSAATALLEKAPPGISPSETELLHLCQSASQAGQYSLVEATCAASGYDPAELELQAMLENLEELLFQLRIDDALLSMNKILQRFPENRIPEFAWQNLCGYGVAAGQYHKVKDACARVPQPEG